MLSVKELKDFKVYRTPILLFDNESKNPRFNQCIYLPTSSEEESIRLMKVIFDNNLFKRNTYTYKSYHVNNYYRYKVHTNLINERLPIRDKYKAIKQEFPNINKTFIKFEGYKNHSIVVDLYKYFSDFIIYSENLSNDRKSIEFLKFIELNLVPVLDRTKKDYNNMMILDLSSINLDDLFRTYNINNFMDLLVYNLRRNRTSTILSKIDMDMVCFIGNLKFKFNIKNFFENKRNINKLMVAIKKLKVNKADDDILEDQELQNSITNKVIDKIESKIVASMTGDTKLDKVTEENMDKIKKKIKEKSKEVDISNENDLIDKLDNDIEFKEIVDTVVNKINTKSLASSKRDMELREKQKSIKLNDKTLDEILTDKDKVNIEPTEIKVKTINDSVKVNNTLSFNKTYIENTKDKDIINIFSSLQDKDVNMYITDIDKEDTSDAFNKKETWTIKLEDEKRKRHTVKFDVPIFVDDRFLYLGGNKKNIINQLMMKPIVKTSFDTVQVCSNYNKIFLTRFGQKVSPKTERFIKTISTINSSNISIKKGNVTSVNKKFKTSIEFDSISTNILSIKARSVLDMNFDINTNITNGIVDAEYPIDKYIPLGKYKGKPLFLDLDTDYVKSESIKEDINLIDFIIDVLSGIDNNISNVYREASAGTKFMYTRATVMAKKVPLILLLSYCEGFTNILNKANIKYEFSDKRVNINNSPDKGLIRFKDGYLIYDKYPFANSLLLNGMSTIPTLNYNLSDLDEKLTYVEIFGDLLDSKAIVNAFDNFYNLFLDPITIEVLNDLNLPTDFVGVLLYANNLLQDNDYINEGHMSNYRLRGPEIVTAMVYKKISTSFEKYLATHNNNNPVKLSIPQDAIIKELLTSNVVEDYSTLNPLLELERTRAVSFKGPNGLNLEQAYTLDKRGFNDSMMGVIAVSSPPSGAVGITRYLTLDPKVTGVRGYIDITDNFDELEPQNIFMSSELATPGVGNHDDAPRILMNTAQTKHITPVVKGSPVLMGNGIEKVLPYVISNDFAFKSKHKGHVKEVTEDIMVLEYDNGEIDVIDLSQNVEKNGGGGYYIVNKLTTKYKEGDKFKENEIIALNDKFFSSNGDILGNNSFMMGSLQKTAILNDDETFEDSASISRKSARDMATEVVMKKDVVLSKYTNIDNIVDIGDDIKSGDNLILFEEGFDDDLSKVLGSIRDDLKEKINEYGKRPIKSKYSGVIEDIKIYYNCEFDELSPSIKKLINKYRLRSKKRKDIVTKYDETKVSKLNDETYEKYESIDSKIKGVTVEDGVLIEFYIKFLDEMSVGDKLTNYCALKSIVCKVHDTPMFTEFRPDEDLGNLVGTRSILARMVGSVFLQLFGNKVLVELGRAVKDIMNEDEEFYKRIDNKYLTSRIKK